MDDTTTDGIATVTAPERVDAYTAPALRTTLINLTSEGRYRVAVDVTAVKAIGSTGLAVLVGHLKRARAHGGDMCLVGPTPSVRHILTTTGPTKKIPIRQEMADAIEYLTTAPEPAAAQPLTADGWTGYTPTDLAWFAEHHADTEWAVHVIGPDDIYTHETDAEGDEDPDAPLLTETTARELAARFTAFGRWYVKRYPAEGALPSLHPVVLHRGVPAQPTSPIDDTTTIDIQGGQA